MGTEELDGLFKALQVFEVRRMLTFLFGVVALALLVRSMRGGSERLFQRFPARRLLILQIVTLASFGVYFLGFGFLIYAVLAPPKELLIAVGGSAAVAIGLSLKDLVASLVAGFILLFDRPFQVGDRVRVGEVYGEVMSIGLRAVRLVTLDDNVVTIPNARLVTDHVSSGNAGALHMMVEIRFHLSLDADLDRVKEMLYEIVVTSRFVYLRKPVQLVVEEVVAAETFCLRVTVKAYVLDVRYEKAFLSDVVERASESFVREGIQRPFESRVSGVAAPPRGN